MPIVPTQPLYKSFFQRLFFNPWGLAKLIIKSIIRPAGKGGNINRTDYRRDFYQKICEEVGFKNIQCIPYNPYWKVNSDGTVENKLTLPFYQWYYRTFKKNKPLSFKTGSLSDLCYLLIAEK